MYENAFRAGLEPQLFMKLESLLRDNVDKEEISVLSHIFRLLRNAVANCKRNQEIVRTRTGIVSECFRYLGNFIENENKEAALIPVRCCLQFITNFMVDNVENANIISTFVNTLSNLMKKTSDEKVIEYASMCIHTLLKLCPHVALELDVTFVKTSLEQTHLEFVLYLVETMIGHENFMEKKYWEMDGETKCKLLGFLVAHTQLHKKLPQTVTKLLADQFMLKSDNILKSQFDGNQETCWEMAILLELLCCLTSTDEPLSMDSSVFISAMYLLKGVHATGTSENSPTTSSNSPVTDLGAFKISVETEEMRSRPTFQFKAHLIRLIANLLHKDQERQNMLRETETLSVILDCCKIDARNPFITQWAVFAIRNACEGNSANQEFIRTMQQIDTQNALDKDKVQLVGL